MPHDRFYINAPFLQGQEVDLCHENRHLKVMRIQEGEVIELVNGGNQLAHASFHPPHQALIESLEECAPPQPTILCQAIPRFNRLEIIVEKGTELGMTELWLFPGKLSEKKTLSPNQLERLQQISIAAMKQCGRLDLPKILLKPPLPQWSSLPYTSYFGDLSPEAPPFRPDGKQEICFLVGPEAGFSSDEEKQLLHMGAHGVKLHPWILRTDTASLVALSLRSQTIPL